MENGSRHQCFALFTLLALTLSIPASGTAQTCQKLVLPDAVNLTAASSGHWSYALASGQLGGGPADDSASLDFFSSGTGTFDLAAGANADFASCEQCVLLVRDPASGSGQQYFFQDQGSLFINAAPGTSPLTVQFTNLRLVEVTLDVNFHSTPVPDGACYVGVNDAVFANGFE